MQALRVQAVGRDPELYGDGVNGSDCLLRQILDRHPRTLKPFEIFKEWAVNSVIYDLGFSWRLYEWYRRGGSARLLSMFLGQNIKFWRDLPGKMRASF
jgi:hypothetical protein